MSNIFAFPSHGSMGEVVEQGMSLRDYFAAKVLQGAIVNASLGGMPGRDSAANEVIELLAAACYATADAMLKAREQ